MSMSSRAVIAAASLTVLGFASGVAGDRLWLAHQPQTTLVVDTGHAERFHALLDSLGLSDDQRAVIDSLLGHFQENVEQTWASLQPRLQTTMDSARDALQAVLDEGQLATFEQWLAREHQQMHRVEHPGIGH